jgi:hypothetical protein
MNFIMEIALKQLSIKIINMCENCFCPLVSITAHITGKARPTWRTDIKTAWREPARDSTRIRFSSDRTAIIFWLRF